MREATGNALLTMMITSIIAVIMIFFVGSLSYSKSYKIKNYIVNEIEENKDWNESVRNTVDSYMKEVGYNVRGNDSSCSKVKADGCDDVSGQSSYNYCVFECNKYSNKYYKVVTFTKFEFPIIGSVMKFEIKGETKTFNYFSS